MNLSFRLLVGMQVGIILLENRFARSTKAKIRPALQSIKSILVIHTTEMCTCVYHNACTGMFSSITHNNSELINKRMGQLLYILTIECYKAGKKRTIFLTIWINYEDISFNELIQIKMSTYCMIPFMENS